MVKKIKIFFQIFNLFLGLMEESTKEDFSMENSMEKEPSRTIILAKKGVSGKMVPGLGGLSNFS